jgi:HSP20 family molecular chaperone IbpA
MDATDTARIVITVTGVGSDTVDVEANETALQIAYLGR